MKNFDSILVANRGEIAVRVIRSAQEQGYRTIAVYSEADAGAAHVMLADEAVLIGAAPVKESYLDPKKILEAARLTGAQAIHPGYGFLSENAAFSQACRDVGIVFIGPAPSCIDLMGNKAASKRLMCETGVPCIPGYQDRDQSDEALISAASEIGVPIMVKAAAGGGGRGMRLVERMEDLSVAINSARSEANNAFGSGELILERAVLQPRHVEVQIFGDSHGNVIHLGERDCSVQRRHQKVVEESPCPVMTPTLRQAMGQTAVNAAKSIDYVGAGTVEFLLDRDCNFYFLEMNTRLQVEHPVTEMVTGLDLVAMQIQVAHGYPLPVTQEDVCLNGHAIEVRLYAEDTGNDFLPAAGIAQTWLPPTGEGIRVDHGLIQGQEISPFYDPMIAKVIAWGDDREIARRRLVRALETTCLFGLSTNREFLIDVIKHNDFVAGEATTAFIEENYSAESLRIAPISELHAVIGACLLYREDLVQSERRALSGALELTGWAGARELSTHFLIGNGDNEPLDIVVQKMNPEPDSYTVGVGDKVYRIKLLAHRESSSRLLVDGVQQTVKYALLGRGEVTVQLGGRAAVMGNKLIFTKGDNNKGGSGTIIAPMHGNVLQVFVATGDYVEEGQDLAVMEAMKMEHRLIAQVAGTVAAVYVEMGQQVASGTVILEVSSPEE